MEMKAKINKWALIKLKSFCAARENIRKMKWQHSEWEKMFAKGVTDKGLVSTIYKQLVWLRIKKKKAQSKSGHNT